MSSARAELFGLDGQSHECVHWVSDKTTCLRAIVAIHDTTRGPAFGGCRMRPYSSELDALADALRLSQGMSLKNALADLPFGGGKSVIMAPTSSHDRTALFLAFGAAVETLAGRYITAEDVGTTADDMRAIKGVTTHVSGIPRAGAFGGDPSPMTALGVYIAIEESVQRHLRRSDLRGTTVAVQGLGAVGARLCELLHEAGAKLYVADVQPERVETIRSRCDALPVDVDRILGLAVDVVAPCALGAILNHESISTMQARIVAGAANNQLATPADGERLHETGILYLPDFLINAGGIISVAREHLGGGDEKAVIDEIGRIRQRVIELMDRARRSGESTASLATRWAHEKLVALPSGEPARVRERR